MIRAVLAALVVAALSIAASRPKPVLVTDLAFCPTPAGPFIPCRDADAIMRREWDV